MNILIADSGGTKTDWAFIDSAGAHYFKGKGLHPAYNTSDELSSEINRSVILKPKSVDQVWFYGTGCYGKSPIQKVSGAITRSIPDCEIHVFDDLTGAGRAHLQQSDGIIAALGTGSICGRYKNGEIIRRSAALGYAIGDEGSAADLGKTVIKGFYREELDKDTHQTVKKILGNEDYSYWMGKIYGSTQPNRVLASIAGDLFKGSLNSCLTEILNACFESFIDSQLLSLHPEKNEQIVFTGTVSNAHKELLRALLKRRNYENFFVKPGLIKGLVAYHKQNTDEQG